MIGLVSYDGGSVIMNGIHSISRPRLYDQYHLKKIGDEYRLIWLDSVVDSGFDDVSPGQRVVVNDSKSIHNLRRAKSAVYEYARCNSWDWFFTGTLDPSLHDRSDLSSFERRFCQMLRDERKKTGFDIKYLIIPELHSDLSSWHCHGLLSGIPSDFLNHYRGNRYNWVRYSNSFGFNSLEPIRSHEAVSKYLVKYVSKSFFTRGVSELFKHSYLASRGLKRAEVIKKGSISGEIDRLPDFESQHCRIWNFTANDLPFLLSLYN